MTEPKLSTDYQMGFISPLVIMAFVIPFVILNAYVVSRLWDWYLVPLLHLPMLRLGYAFGISLLAQFLVNRPFPRREERSGVLLGFQIAKPFITLLLGWFGTFFL